MHIYVFAYWMLIIATRRSSFIAACTSFLMSIALHHVSDKVRAFGKTLERGTYINGVNTCHPDDHIQADPVVRMKPRIDVVEEKEQASSSLAVVDAFDARVSPIQQNSDSTENTSMIPIPSGNDSAQDLALSCSTDSLLVLPPLQDSRQDL